MINSNDPPDARGPIKRIIICDSSISKSDLSSENLPSVFYYPKPPVLIAQSPVFCFSFTVSRFLLAFWTRREFNENLYCLLCVISPLLTYNHMSGDDKSAWGRPWGGEREITITSGKFIAQEKRKLEIMEILLASEKNENGRWRVCGNGAYGGNKTLTRTRVDSVVTRATRGCHERRSACRKNF